MVKFTLHAICACHKNRRFGQKTVCGLTVDFLLICYLKKLLIIDRTENIVMNESIQYIMSAIQLTEQAVKHIDLTGHNAGFSNFYIKSGHKKDIHTLQLRRKLLQIKTMGANSLDILTCFSSSSLYKYTFITGRKSQILPLNEIYVQYNNTISCENSMLSSVVK